MDLATQQLMRYDTTSGLLDDHVLSLAKQGNDTIWAGTVRGLTRIVRNTNTNTSENTSKFAPDLWQISPNPTAEFLNITTNNTQSTANFQLFDNLGRLVFETDVSNFKQISLKNLPNGIYFAKLKNENLGVRKIIISSH